jgi:hypothetical protein
MYHLLALRLGAIDRHEREQRANTQKRAKTRGNHGYDKSGSDLVIVCKSPFLQPCCSLPSSHESASAPLLSK